MAVSGRCAARGIVGIAGQGATNANDTHIQVIIVVIAGTIVVVIIAIHNQ